MDIEEVTTVTRKFSDLMTGEDVAVTETPVPVTITIDGVTSANLYFAPESLAAVRALATEDGEGFRERFAPVKRSGAGRSSGPTTNTYPGTNQVVKTVRKWAQANGGTKVDGSPVTDSGLFKLSDETFAKMLAANPTWAAGFGESEGAGARIADKVIGASADAKPSGVTVAGTAVKKERTTAIRPTNRAASGSPPEAARFVCVPDKAVCRAMPLAARDPAALRKQDGTGFAFT
jgi:hypothetical protein